MKIWFEKLKDPSKNVSCEDLSDVIIKGAMILVYVLDIVNSKFRLPLI